MNISINLLPAEVRAEQLKEKKFYRIQAVSIIVMLVLAFLASATVALGVLQSQDVNQAKDDLSAIENEISGYKSTESSYIALKERLNSIEQIQGSPSKQRVLYNLINNLSGSLVSINTISIDDKGNIILAVQGPNIAAIESFIDNVLSKEKNEGTITSMSLDNLARGKDGTYRMNVSIKTK